MADTVEQVHVWDGTDWVPVVRDDCDLPISSADGTVTLDSPSANTFAVSTGGQERVVVKDDTTTVLHRLLCGSEFLQAEMGMLKTDATVWSINQPHVYGIGHSVCEVINFQQDQDHVYSGYSMSAFNSAGIEQSAFIGIVSRDNEGLPAIGGDVVITARNDGSNQVELLRINNEAATFSGDIQTSRIVGATAPNSDAAIELGAELLTSNHTPTQPNSIATKQTVDDKIWVGTTAQYNAIATKNPTTLYCLTD